MTNPMTDNSAETARELPSIVRIARAFLAHFNPCNLAEDKSQQWQALARECDVLEHSAATVSRDREAIARIIDPEAFGENFGRLDPQMRENRRASAMRKADAILSLHPGSDVVQPSCEQSDSATHRESVTELGIELWRHKKRGTIYRILHNNVPMQEEQTEGRRLDDEPMVVYQDVSSGAVYVRPVVEMWDGRSEPLSTDASACPSDGFLRSSLNQSNFSAGAEAMREACVKVAADAYDEASITIGYGPACSKNTAHKIGAALSALPLPSEQLRDPKDGPSAIAIAQEALFPPMTAPTGGLSTTMSPIPVEEEMVQTKSHKEPSRSVERARTGSDLTAKSVPFSSVVGSSVVFTNASGAVVIQLAVMVPSPQFEYREHAEPFVKRLVALWNGDET